MADIEQMAAWLEISEALLRDLLPKDSGVEIFGHGMSADAFAALVDRESAKVDHALVAMATAQDEHAVREIFSQLSHDTVITLFSRWAHYIGAWRELADHPMQSHWVPGNNIWRAVLLAMTQENEHSTIAAQSLWPDEFGAEKRVFPII